MEESRLKQIEDMNEATVFPDKLYRRGFLGLLLKLVTVGTALGVAPEILTPFKHKIDEIYAGPRLDAFLQIIAGTGAGQVRRIVGYDSSTKTAQVMPAWLIEPDASSVFYRHK